MKRVLKGLAVTVAVLAVLYAGMVACVQWTVVEKPRRQLDIVRVGWTKEQVLHRLGKPEYLAQNRKDLFSFGDNALPSRPIDNVVWQYTKAVWVLYVYIDGRGRVSYTFMSRT